VLGINCLTNAQGTYVVQSFGRNLSNWAAGENTFSALETVERLCSKKPAFRIGDEIMQSLARKNGLAKTNTYNWDTYIACLQKEVDNGIKIQFSEINPISENQIDISYKGFQYASCNIKISGTTNINESALFILKDGKIAKIQNYETTIDSRTGKHKIKVDWSGIELDEDTEGIGILYNYGKSFPVGASIMFSYWKFMLSADFGLNLDDDIYTTHGEDYTNANEYKITRSEYDLKYYFTLTPAFYLKYFAIGCGFGYASLNKDEYVDEHSLTDYNGTSVSSTKSSASASDKYKFMVRPTVRGFIPCNDELFISLSVSYDWILGYKDKSNISFGIGIHYLLDL
jgi:hypothetical protein